MSDIRRSKLGRSLVFAALAALASTPWIIATTPVSGRGLALSGYGLGLLVLYILAIAPNRIQGIRVAALAAGLALIALVAGWLAASPFVVPLVLGTAALGLLRSGFLYRSRPGRSLLVESGLLLGGWLFAIFLAHGTILSLALGIWGFFLVQSLFFAIEGSGPVGEESARDPFEVARERALALLGDEG